MSTSPSWFDQDKFSRLVKKVGPKSAAATGAPTAPAKPASRPSARESAPTPEAPSLFTAPAAKAPALAPVQKDEPLFAPDPEPIPETAPAPIPQPSEPIRSLPLSSSAPAETPAPSPLRQRTTPLPNLKPIFEYDKPVSLPPSQSQPMPGRPVLTPQTPVLPTPPYETFGLRDAPLGFTEEEQEEEESEEEIPALPESITEAKAEPPEPASWDISNTLKEDLSRVTEERDDARRQSDLLRSQLLEYDDVSKERDELAAKVEELSRVVEERDDARNESNLLRSQLQQAEEANGAAQAQASSPEELSRALEERDGARRDYASLREQFENLKLEHVRLRGEPAKKDPALEAELETLRAQLAERDQQIAELKNAPAPEPVPAPISEDTSALQTQLNQAREDASIAQRGLALSQKALQETRDALREASEGSSMAKTNLDNLKNECATLVQQNMLLQAQHDQLTRELNALKAKVAGRP